MIKHILRSKEKQNNDCVIENRNDVETEKLIE